MKIRVEEKDINQQGNQLTQQEISTDVVHSSGIYSGYEVNRRKNTFHKNRSLKFYIFIISFGIFSLLTGFIAGRVYQNNDQSCLCIFKNCSAQTIQNIENNNKQEFIEKNGKIAGGFKKANIEEKNFINIEQVIKKASDQKTKHISKSNFKEISDQKFYRRIIFNEQNAQKPFGKHEKFYVNISKIIPQAGKFWKSLNPSDTKGPNDTVYTLIPTDLDKLVNFLDFQKVKEDMINYISYELLEFKQDKSINMQIPNIQYQHFKNDKQIQDYLQNLKKQALNRKQQHSQNLNFQLSSQLIRNPNKKEVLQAEYYIFNKNYGIGSRKKQNPICIYSGGYNLYKRNQYKQFFQSIQRLNYTNYHVVYTDDNSDDEFSYKVYDYIKSNNFRVKNKIKMIRTLQSVGSLGNIYIWINKYCNEDDIVVMMDGDDGFLGTQSLQLLNKLYEQHQNYWYIYTKLVTYNPKENKINPGDTSTFLYLNTSEYRRSGFFMASSLRSFRYKLVKMLPVYQVAQYHFDSSTNIAWPSFPLSAYDSYLVYGLFELAGNERIYFLNEYIYNYYPSGMGTRSCYLLHQWFDGTKSVLRTPLQKVKSFGEKAKQVKNYKYPQDKFKSSIEINGNGISYKCYQK